MITGLIGTTEIRESFSISESINIIVVHQDDGTKADSKCVVEDSRSSSDHFDPSELGILHSAVSKLNLKYLLYSILHRPFGGTNTSTQQYFEV